MIEQALAASARVAAWATFRSTSFTGSEEFTASLASRMAWW